MTLISTTVRGGEYNMESNAIANQEAMDEIHAFRKEIDAVIVKAQALQNKIGRTPGGREVSLVVTKLQEGKMWAGKILEAYGSPFPKELADKAE